MDVLASPLSHIYVYVDFRTSYSWACVWEYKDEEGGMECSCGFAVSPLFYSRVLQVAVGAAAVVRSKSGMILLNVDMFEVFGCVKIRRFLCASQNNVYICSLSKITRQ